MINPQEFSMFPQPFFSEITSPSFVVSFSDSSTDGYSL